MAMAAQMVSRTAKIQAPVKAPKMATARHPAANTAIQWWWRCSSEYDTTIVVAASTPNTVSMTTAVRRSQDLDAGKG